MSNIVSAAVAVGLFCALASAPALARPEAQGAVVRLADLNLATAAGEQALHGRINRAVDRVCGEVDLRDLRAMSAKQACRTATLAKVTPQVEVAIADARSGKSYAVDTTKVTAPAS